MIEYIEENITVIRKYLNKRKKVISELNKTSIMEEFKEWSKYPIPVSYTHLTLPTTPYV